VKNIYEYYAKWIREGKLKVNSDWNKDLKVKFTVQDPCQIIRKSYGDPIAEDLRFIVKSVVGEENFIDMTPNMSNNYCCGGGGGFLQSGYRVPPKRITVLRRAITAMPRFMIYQISTIMHGVRYTCGR
jgi:Fe-S oxidoreductase